MQNDMYTIRVYVIVNADGVPLIEYRPSVTAEGARWQLIRAVAEHPNDILAIGMAEHCTGEPLMFRKHY